MNIRKKFNSIIQQIVRATHTWYQPNGYDTGIMIYNPISKDKVPLIVRNKSYVTWYTCGPTVYDSAHIGHASCYVNIDIIQRILQHYFNLNVISAMNITNIDDKIIKKGNELKIPWKNIAERFEKEFWFDLKKLNVPQPNIKIRVTDNIHIIKEFIAKLLENGLAYLGQDNSIYFNVNSCQNYGKIHKVTLENKQTDIKRSSVDFVLWKSEKPYEPFWESPWGNGRPGWHIECSAMASELFGDSLDFHAGGQDLIFPHHENEEAQSCAFHNCKQWVNYWVHVGLLQTEQSEKMSKSLKNTITITELLNEYSSDEFRMACILSNYRSPLQFSKDTMLNARTLLKKFQTFDIDCTAFIDGKKGSPSVDNLYLNEKFNEVNYRIDLALKDDFNTPECIKQLLRLTTVVNKILGNSNTPKLYKSSNVGIIAGIQNYIRKTLRIFGFLNNTENIHNLKSNDKKLIEIIDEIVNIRKEIRSRAVLLKSKEFYNLSDEIRSRLKGKGIEIKDHETGSSWIVSE